MKKFIPQLAELVLCLEKDDPRNISGMQMRVWSLNNRTSIVVRLFKHKRDVGEIFWDRRTNYQVEELMLKNLADLKLINNTDNWNCLSSEAIDFRSNDGFEEKENCIYFFWSVKPNLIKF